MSVSSITGVAAQAWGDQKVGTAAYDNGEGKHHDGNRKGGDRQAPGRAKRGRRTPVTSRERLDGHNSKEGEAEKAAEGKN